MHTIIVIFGVTVEVFLALALVSVIVGLVWIAFPLKNEIYTSTGQLYWYSTPLGGRETGLIILGSGLIGLTIGFLLDKTHVRLTKKFGARI